MSRQVVASTTQTLLDGRGTKFPNLELGLNIKSKNEDGLTSTTSEPQVYRGELIISKPVSRQRIDDFLQMPVAWDADGMGKLDTSYNAFSLADLCHLHHFAEGSFEKCPAQVIDRVTIDYDGDILPSSASFRPTFVHQAKRRNALFIEFSEERTLRRDFGQLVDRLFDFLKPFWVAGSDELQPPRVVIKMYDGISGLKRFVTAVSRLDRAVLPCPHDLSSNEWFTHVQLESVLRLNLVAELIIEVEEWPDPEESQPEEHELHAEFERIIKMAAETWRRCWPAMKAHWPNWMAEGQLFFVVNVKFGRGYKLPSYMYPSKFKRITLRGEFWGDGPGTLEGTEAFWAYAHAIVTVNDWIEDEIWEERLDDIWIDLVTTDEE